MICQGYALIHGVEDRAHDIVIPETILRYRGRDIYREHKYTPRGPIGHVQQYKRTPKGLWVRCDLDLARRPRDITGLSVGFITRYRDGKYLLDIEIWEVSICRYPIQPSTLVWSS